MKTKHSALWFGGAILVFVFIYSWILFSVKLNMTEAHWLLYGFTLLAFMSFGLVLGMTAKTRGEITFDIPIVMITGIYAAVQFIVCGVLMMLFSGIPFGLVCIVEFTLLGVFLIMEFTLVGVEENAIEQNDKDQAAVKHSRMVETSILTLMGKAENEEVKKKLRNLSEKAHFADVYDGPEVQEIDAGIQRNLIALEEDMADNDIDVSERIEKIGLLFEERNRIAAINR